MNGTPHNMSQVFDKIRSDWDMSRQSRFIRQRTGLAPQGGTGDYHYRSESKYYQDIEKCRDMDRNDAIVGQTIDRAVSNVIQGGFTLDVNTGDRRLNAELKARWLDWSEDEERCDIAGEFTWHDFEQTAMRSMLLDGDIFALAVRGGQLQMLEAHTIQETSKQKDTFLGVTINEFRKHLKVWVTQDATTPHGSKSSVAKPVDVRDEKGNRQVFHVYNPRRVTMTRGVSALGPIFALAGMFEDINFAKLVQQQVVSCFAVFREQAFAPHGGEDPPSVEGYGQGRDETSPTGQTRRIEDIAPGMEVIGNPGQKLHGFSPNVPNAEFFSHVRLMLQLIGVNLGLPLCLVLMDGSETNFSGWRGAVDEARKGFRQNQKNIMKRFHSPVYKWKVREWMKSDAALKAAAQNSKINIFGHTWNAPTWQYIDPIKDAQGDAIRLQNGLTSYRRLHNEGGRDWEDISTEMVDDSAMAIIKAKKKAQAINKKYDDGQPVHWRELISLPMPNGLKMTMQDPNVIEAQKEGQDG